MTNKPTKSDYAYAASVVRRQRRQKAQSGFFAHVRAPRSEASLEYARERIKAAMSDVEASQTITDSQGKVTLSLPAVIERELQNALGHANPLPALSAWLVAYHGRGAGKCIKRMALTRQIIAGKSEAIRKADNKATKAELRRWNCPVNAFTVSLATLQGVPVAAVWAAKYRDIPALQKDEDKHKEDS